MDHIETALWQAYTTDRSIDNRNRLIEHYIPYMESRACLYLKKRPRARELDEIKSHATLGLINAVERFDPTPGFKFSTYAHIRIMGSITDALREQSPYPTRDIPRVQKRAIEGARLAREGVWHLPADVADAIPCPVNLEADVFKNADAAYVIALVCRIQNASIRGALVLYHYMHMFQDEIARLYNVTAVCISLRLRKGYARMRKMIEMDRLNVIAYDWK